MVNGLQRITFSEFGRRFIQIAITSERLKGIMNKSLSPRSRRTIDRAYIEGGSWYEGQYFLDLENLNVTNGPPEDNAINFITYLPIKMALHIQVFNMIPEEYHIDINVRLTSKAQTFSPPLLIFVPFNHIASGDVSFTRFNKESWTDLAKRFGGLEEKLKNEIINYVNPAIDDAIRKGMCQHNVEDDIKKIEM